VARLDHGAWGYRFSDVPIATKIPEQLVTVRVHKIKNNATDRQMMQRHLCGMLELAPPYPDTGDVATVLHGIKQRMGRPHNQWTHAMKQRMRSFVRSWCHKHLRPLTDTEMLTFEQWLDLTNYNDQRKEQLRESYKSLLVTPLNKNDYVNIVHGKGESYVTTSDDQIVTEFKAARGIYSRLDRYKVWLGHKSKSIEIVAYKMLRGIIKHIPDADRPRYIYDLLYRDGASYFGTDFSAYESSISPAVMECIELEVYAYMLKNVIGAQQIMSILHESMASAQKCKMKGSSFTCFGRMSGEMTTALGNTLINLIFNEFMCRELNHWEQFEALVEGDDGLIRIDGPVPTVEQYREWGFDIKIEMHRELNESQFCQVVYNPIDYNPIIDPAKAVLKCMWTDSQCKGTKNLRMLKGLLKAKVASLRARAPRVPILWRFGSQLEKSLGDYNMIFELKQGQRYDYGHVYNFSLQWAEPTMIDRDLVERVYHISIQDQLMCEDYFSHWDPDFIIENSLVIDVFSKLSGGLCREYALRYVRPR